ncbi:MAG: SusC/RagA family TonB-linked outer membrane protein [Candidatus Palauibacterales bacterium]|nr:SusC/RagA family TonB-linked outer membrane protein [Candidatus Palauibacterales bacterium]MDP2528276.1 SusC/RagA family TonB-linked outer membrane protein [Candidatus Palauibacterales bacterium]MDP2584827.1 SusC/RagA family TonB-linked outer membrane protein [Candidatus Palauibacterales bacterium]
MCPHLSNRVRSLLGAALAVLMAAGIAVGTTAPLHAQQATVLTGKVTDQNGKPLASATIQIKSLGLGTIADQDGNYSFTVPASRVQGQSVVVTASLLSYRSVSASITLQAGTISHDFALAFSPLQLEAIVATGQGTQTTRARVGATINTVDSSAIVDSRATNIIDALAGKAPNVEVTSSGGEPGAGTYIHIRGFRTLNGSNQPLIVVDGTPINNSSNNPDFVNGSVGGTVTQNRASDINPNDVASVQILKGPAATSLYGSDGANGVVLITTKSGQSGATRLTVKSTYTWDQVNKMPPLQTSFGQLGSTSWGPKLACVPNCVVGKDVFDHAHELFQTANRFDNDITFSGGGEATTYFLSAGFNDDQSFIVGPHSAKKATVRLKGSHNLLDNLTLSGNFAYTNQDLSLVQQGSNISGLLLGALRTPPEFNNANYLTASGLQRSYRNPDPTTLTEPRGYDNPFWIAKVIRNTSSVGHTFGNIRADYNPFPWLSFSETFGADYSQTRDLELFPKSSDNYLDGGVIKANYNSFDVDNILTGTAQHDFTPDVSASLTVGQNIHQSKTNNLAIEGNNLIYGTDQLQSTVKQVPNDYVATTRADRYYAEGHLDLYNQLFLTGSVNNEGSSTFGGNGKRFTYPSAQLAWEFTKLPAFDNLGWLNYGKLHFAYGEAAKAPPIYSNVNAFQTSSYGDGWVSSGLQTIYRGETGVISQGTLGNTDIAPERTREYEGGLDLSFLDNRVTLSGTYYYQKTTDAILSVPLAPSSGYSARYENAASFRNKGIEISADFTPIRMSNFSWQLNAQWSRNRSRVLALPGASNIFLAGFTDPYAAVLANQCGPTQTDPCPFGEIYGDDFVRFGRGITVGGVNIDNAFPNAKAGELYIGPDGYPVYDPTFRTIGDPNPSWTASFRNTFHVMNNLTITGLVDVSHGAMMWNGTRGALTYFGKPAATAGWHCQSGGAPPCPGDGQNFTFQGAGPGAGMQVNLTPDWALNNLGSGFTGPASQFMENASFVKLRDVTVRYTFNQDWVSKLGANRIELALSGRNLKTWTNYTGIDPETNLTGQSTGRGLDYFQNPQVRSWIVTVSYVR